MGGQQFVFRARPARLEPVVIAAPAKQVAPKDFSDATRFSMPAPRGVRDVNEVY